MSLMIAPDVDADLDVDHNYLREDLNLAALCSCSCGPGAHSAEGCRESGCPCSARCDLELAGGEPREELEAEVAARVVAVMAAIRKRRKVLEDDREAAGAKDPLRRFNRPVKRRPKAPASEPRAPRVNLTKVTVRRGKVISPAPPPADDYSRSAWQHPDEEVLEAAEVL